MALYKTLDDKQYSVQVKHYLVNWRGKSASEFQRRVRSFFYYIWPKTDIICEEFPVKPYLKNRYRLDLFNVTKNIAVEVHGQQHIEHIPYFNKTEQDFYQAVRKDKLKADFCEHNGIKLVEIYPTDPLSLKWLEKTYPHIPWDLEY